MEQIPDVEEIEREIAREIAEAPSYEEPSTEFLKFRELLDAAGIPWHDFSEHYDNYGYVYHMHRTHGDGFSVIYGRGSYGAIAGLLEASIEGAGVTGWLTAEEAFEMVKERLEEMSGNMSYGFGDWVVYDSGYKSEIGRVTECHGRSAFVCYHQGCTAASTSLDKLRPATDAEIASAPAGIGFHRFDATCPSRNDECCRMCRAEKG